MRTRRVNDKVVPFTPEQEAARDAEEAAQAAKPKREKPVDVNLNRKESLSLIDFYESNGIITSASARKMKGSANV